jgi:hypothetical protein
MLKILLLYSGAFLLIAEVALVLRISAFRRDYPKWERHSGPFGVPAGSALKILSRHTYTESGQRLLPWLRSVAALLTAVVLLYYYVNGFRWDP